MGAIRKPEAAVGGLGEHGHGKTTLAEALVLRARARLPGTDPGPAHTFAGYPGNRDRLDSLRVAPYETEARRYLHLDGRYHTDLLHGLIAGQARMDGAVLVVAANAEAREQAAEQLRLMRWLGVRQLVVFVNKLDALMGSHELRDRAEWRVRDFLTRQGWPGDDLPVVCGSASAALASQGQDEGACRCLDELLAVVDSWSLPLVRPVEDEPLLLRVEEVATLPHRPPLVIVQVERGQVKADHVVEVIGPASRPHFVRVLGLEQVARVKEHVPLAPRRKHFQRYEDVERLEWLGRQKVALPGETVGLRLRGLKANELERGHALATPGSIGTAGAFEAVLLSRTAGLYAARRMLCIGGAEVLANVVPSVGELDGPLGLLACVRVELLPGAFPIALGPGTRFTLGRRGARSPEWGVVTRLLGGGECRPAFPISATPPKV